MGIKIIEIEIDDYKILKKGSIKLKGEQIYPKGSQILGLIGSNGSGKTTICSMISWLFQSIYTCSKLDFNIKIIFLQNDDLKTIECKNSRIKLQIDNSTYYEFDLGVKLREDKRNTHDQKIRFFWDGRIILSTFEINGEYPNKKSYNYKGHDPLIKYDTAEIYGKNIFGYPSITNGMLRFLESNMKQDIARSFLKEMGFELLDEIEVKIVRSLMPPNEFVSTSSKLDQENCNEDISFKIRNDKRIKLTPEPQILSTQLTKEICKDYSEYIGNSIFLNGFRLRKDNVSLGFENLSSGEKFLIIRYLSILSGAEMNSIIIVEEPENHLNPKWRELIIPALHKIATAYDSILIFTTHDHRAIRYLHNNCVLNLSKGIIKKVRNPILLCDEFDFESIGEKPIPFVYKDLQKVYLDMDKNEKAKLLKSICNVEEKIILRKQFLEEYAQN